MIGHRLFASEPIGNLFYLHAVIFEIPKQYFIIKPPACWGADVSIEINELLLLFSIITPWFYLQLMVEDSPRSATRFYPWSITFQDFLKWHVMVRWKNCYLQFCWWQHHIQPRQIVNNAIENLPSDLKIAFFHLTCAKIKGLGRIRNRLNLSQVKILYNSFILF